MRKKDLLIVIGITPDWGFAAGTLLAGIKKHLKFIEPDVTILLNKKDKDVISSLKAIYECKVRIFKSPFKSIDMDKFKRVSIMAFSRFECFRMLTSYKKVVWIDADALIQGDFTERLSDIQTDLGMYKHPDTPISVSFSKPLPGYKMDEDCYNDGIFILTDQITNGDSIADWAYDKTIEFYDFINSDQAIFNLLIQEFNLNVTSLDVKFNCPPSEITSETFIAHPWGKNKFWNGIYNSTWNSYYMEWKKINGESSLVENRYFRYIKFNFKKLKKNIKRLLS